MKEAIKLAKKAESLGEVPIGAVIVYDGKIIGRGYNKRKKTEKTAAHAEMIAINQANKHIGSWRLEDCDIYVTLEPCPMCSGAIFQARMRKIYYGADDPKAGALGSKYNLFDVDGLNHYCEYEGHILEDECSELLKSFFKNLRIRNQKEGSV